VLFLVCGDKKKKGAERNSTPYFTEEMWSKKSAIPKESNPSWSGGLTSGYSKGTLRSLPQDVITMLSMVNTIRHITVFILFWILFGDIARRHSHLW